MAIKVLAVVPARMESSRFPGKVLHSFRGRPLICHLLDDIRKSRKIHQTVVATDSSEIKKALADYDVEVVTTKSHHRTGSDRANEAARKVGGDIIINIQADNFGLKGTLLDRVIDSLKVKPKIEYATLGRRITDEDDLFDPNVVKLITDNKDRVLWFSRYPLPYLQNLKKGKHVDQWPFLQHIGVYFFRREALKRYAAWPSSALEKAESLEQTRILLHEKKIQLFRTRSQVVSVDTKDDLRKLDRIYR
jgi:3-deoxy-manno-octulosonate cytidylyltransferase (CMP-KDO synthetase)